LASLAPFGRVSKVLRPTGRAGSASAVSRRRPADVAAFGGVPSQPEICLERASSVRQGRLVPRPQTFAWLWEVPEERGRRPHDSRADGPQGRGEQLDREPLVPGRSTRSRSVGPGARGGTSG